MTLETEGTEGSERQARRTTERINAAAQLARASTIKARVAASQVERVDANRLAVRTLMEAADLSSSAMHELLDAGAVLPSPRPEPSSFDLSALAVLDTPSARQLLDVLRVAQQIAEQVDADRGRVLPADIALQPGESRGTDLAETISELVLRLRIEVEGPKGLDR